jgi:hypothetical protein
LLFFFSIFFSAYHYGGLCQTKSFWHVLVEALVHRSDCPLRCMRSVFVGCKAHRVSYMQSLIISEVSYSKYIYLLTMGSRVPHCLPYSRSNANTGCSSTDAIPPVPKHFCATLPSQPRNQLHYDAQYDEAHTETLTASHNIPWHYKRGRHSAFSQEVHQEVRG